jgi:hypothetical protein
MLYVGVKLVATWLVRNVSLAVMTLVRSVAWVEKGTMKWEKQAKTTKVPIPNTETRLLETRVFRRYRMYNQKLLGMETTPFPTT